ncbi:MAG: peptidase S46 [[Chlorobium] sp. 445]|nr:MAG: peptidase S46 [[Chlorobium] sp. 445]
MWRYKTVLSLLFFLTALSQTFAQLSFNPDTVKAGKFDNGKMWTFDKPPADFFEKEYGFRPDEAWFTRARRAALRFTEVGGTGSFVSPNGLIMTNHHVAREIGTQVERKGENFNENGFYAASRAEERPVPGLFVDQLEKIEDVTARVQAELAKAKDDNERIALREKILEQLKQEYAEKPEWRDLNIQAITFYSGGKYSLYGFKRYSDVRLVFLPELQLGYFGGDPDNFTYPRYALDVAFLRAYDENGNPCKTPDYYKFNTDGVKENEPVFVVGNPGSTERLSTMAQLEFNRDVLLPAQLRFLKARSAILKDYNKTAKSDSILNVIFSYENSIKAFSGQLRGLQDPYLFARKRAFEREFRAKVAANPALKNEEKLWDDMSALYAEMRKLFPERFGLNPQGEGLQTAFLLMRLARLKELGDTAQVAQTQMLLLSAEPADMTLETALLEVHLATARDYLGENDEYVKTALQGSSIPDAAKRLASSSKLYDPKFLQDLVMKSAQEISATQDPLLQLIKIAYPRFINANRKNFELSAKADGLRARLAKLFFDVYGESTPPDATFSLRINDGVVKGYEYNGTEAPAKTTFFGLYDRYYSHNKKYPWNLPKRWETPPMDLLPVPLNFVTTNDIIGGNSGSAVINKNLEAVGLIFDGNIESLPGSFIYTQESNRAVAVHAGGIIAALKYIYRAERLIEELTGEKPKMQVEPKPDTKKPASRKR